MKHYIKKQIIYLMYKDELSVFVPNSFLSESKDLKVRTYKVGILGRALAVFRANRVVVYNDTGSASEMNEEDGKFIAEVLNFMNTPQYLRKRAFPIKAELKHVGILPPLRAPHHPVNDSPDVGDYRQGFTVKRNKKGTFVDIGMDKLAFCKEQLSVKRIFESCKSSCLICNFLSMQYSLIYSLTFSIYFFSTSANCL